MKHAYKVVGTAIGLAALLFTATACSTGSGGGSSDSPAAAGQSSAAVAAAKKAVAAASTTVNLAIPTGHPGATHKKIFLIAVDQSLEGIVRAGNGVQQAAKALGWDVTLVDGKSSPDLISAGIERAVAEHADGIVDIAFPLDYVQTAVNKAVAAHIPIVTTTSFTKPSNPGLFADIGSLQMNKLMGAQVGNWAVADSNGNADVLLLNDTSYGAGVKVIVDGAQESIQKCKTCTVAGVDGFVGADASTKLAQLVQTALLKDPKINYVMAPYDAAATFVDLGVRDAGRSGKVKVISTGGDLANLGVIRSGGAEKMVAAQPLEYGGWLAVNALNEAFNGEKSAPPFELPTKVIVAGNLPPAGKSWSGDNNWQAGFKKLWGR